MRTATEWGEFVRVAANELGMLDERGELVEMDSLVLVDFVVELERLGAIEIPSETLRPDTFKSVDTVVAMLGSLPA